MKSPFDNVPQTADPRYKIERRPCPTCEGRGRIKGTRARAGNCGTHRGTLNKTCGDCQGRGWQDHRLRV